MPVSDSIKKAATLLCRLALALAFAAAAHGHGGPCALHDEAEQFLRGHVVAGGDIDEDALRLRLALEIGLAHLLQDQVTIQPQEGTELFQGAGLGMAEGRFTVLAGLIVLDGIVPADQLLHGRDLQQGARIDEQADQGRCQQGLAAAVLGAADVVHDRFPVQERMPQSGHQEERPAGDVQIAPLGLGKDDAPVRPVGHTAFRHHVEHDGTDDQQDKGKKRRQRNDLA